MNLADRSGRLDQSTQPSGVPAHGMTRGGSTDSGTVEQQLFALHARLCGLVPDPQERADLIGVPASVDAAWLEGRMLPVLRAQRKHIQAAIERIEYDTTH